MSTAVKYNSDNWSFDRPVMMCTMIFFTWTKTASLRTSVCGGGKPPVHQYVWNHDTCIIVGADCSAITNTRPPANYDQWPHKP